MNIKFIYIKGLNDSIYIYIYNSSISSSSGYLPLNLWPKTIRMKYSGIY